MATTRKKPARKRSKPLARKPEPRKKTSVNVFIRDGERLCFPGTPFVIHEYADSLDSPAKKIDEWSKADCSLVNEALRLGYWISVPCEPEEVATMVSDLSWLFLMKCHVNYFLRDKRLIFHRCHGHDTEASDHITSLQSEGHEEFDFSRRKSLESELEYVRIFSQLKQTSSAES